MGARGVVTSIPVFPRPFFPVYKDWKEVFETNKVNKDTGLVGHSAGAEFILRWLSENVDVSVERAVLVAPYHDYEGKYENFSRYTLDTQIPKRIGSLTIITSLDDDEPILKRTRQLAGAIPEAEVIELNGLGHFRIGHNMISEEFPALLEILMT